MADDLAAVWLDTDPAMIEVRVSIELPEQFRTEWDAARAAAVAARVDRVCPDFG